VNPLVAVLLGWLLLGWLLLAEQLTVRIALAAVVIVAGVGLIVTQQVRTGGATHRQTED
jgi:drug/metabolite transporter (DMT)-like permease